MLLLDTHIWIRWHHPQPNRLALPQNLITLIETSERVAISAISCWELGQLVKRKRVKLSLSLEEWVEATIEEDIEILIPFRSTGATHRSPKPSSRFAPVSKGGLGG
jgi:PIN domain nuclease of toxin-antitoxin system